MGSLPQGTVTFFFSDIEGSTRRWEQAIEVMARVLARHDEILVSSITDAGGHVVKHTGDGVLAVFASASGAVSAALAVQRVLGNEPWPDAPLRVRIGLHSGEAVSTGGDYFGPALNRTARVMAAGWGGQILCTAATVELARDRLGEGVGFLSLGEHHLRDLDQPVALWQVLHPDLDAEHPSVRSLDRTVGNVPVRLSSFVGRRREVAGILGELSDARVLTLCGAGGVGKTRLALEVASEAQHDHPDGVWVCELAPLSDPEAVPGVVAATFGLVQQPGRRLVDTLADYLEHRQAVLVLDNCEHLLDDAAELSEELCRRCPGLRVLVTSQAPLGVEGERVHIVAPLEGAEAVELFVERARAVQPSFVADDATREICRHLDGIPLALEMAAARVRSMRPREIAARLDERFRLLVGGRRSPDRHQTLRATVSWSHDLLNDRERRVFRRLAVFAGSFGLDAAEAVARDDALDALDIDDLIDSLVTKSLVVAEEGIEGATRYRLLETMRQFAQEQLVDAGEDGQRRRMHALHYIGFVNEAAEGLRGEDEPTWADRVAEELDNLRAGESWAVAQNDSAVALGLFAPMPPTSLAEPVSYEIFTWIDAALELNGADAQEHFWPALNWRCLRSLNLLEMEALRTHFERIRLLPRYQDHPEAHFAPALLSIAVAGDLPAAAASYAQAATLYTAQGDAYHAIRHRAMNLWCRAGLTVDDALRSEIQILVSDARLARSPYMISFAIAAGAATAPGVIFDDPALALARLEDAAPHAARSRNPFVLRTIGGNRILALTLLGDPTALAQALDSIVASRNLNQMAYKIAALSVAFELLGHHQEAAELIGVSGPIPTYQLYANVGSVNASWERTRSALGEVPYQAAVARGATRNLEELLAWLQHTLSELTATVRP